MSNTAYIEIRIEEAIGVCGCGSPERLYELFLGYLRWVHWRNNLPKEPDAWERRGELYEKSKAGWEDRVPVSWDSPSAELLRNWADREKLTEHGGSITWPWLTEKGEALLADLLAIQSNPPPGLPGSQERPTP